MFRSVPHHGPCIHHIDDDDDDVDDNDDDDGDDDDHQDVVTRNSRDGIRDTAAEGYGCFIVIR